MTTGEVRALSRAERRRRITLALLRSAAVTAVLVAAYYLCPLDRLSHVPIGISLTVGLVALTTVATYQVRSIVRARHPAVRAVEALSVTAPLFLLLFAASYYLMAKADAANFNVHTLTRTDALYFTVTVFATVGFGDISPRTELARLVVMSQMLFGLVAFGLVARLLLGAVEVADRRQDTEEPDAVHPSGS